MTILQIQSFLALAERLNFSKTADFLYVSQPVLSKRINSLEEELNIKLFFRDSHTVRLTDAGSILFYYLQAEEVEFQSVYEHALNVHRKARQMYRIGVLDNLDSLGINIHHIAGDLQAAYPFATIELHQRAYPYRPGDILSRDFDLVLSMDDLFRQSTELCFYPLSLCKTHLFFSGLHPLAGKQDLSPKDFENEQFYIAESTDSETLKRWALKMLRKHNVFPKKMTAMPQTSSVFANVLCGLGVAVADEPAVAGLLPPLSGLEIGEHRLGILYLRKNESPPIIYLRDRMLEAIKCPD